RSFAGRAVDLLAEKAGVADMPRVHGEMIRCSWPRATAGQQPGQRGHDRRSAQDSCEGLTWRWRTATWWRRMRISVSLAQSERASKANQAKDGEHRQVGEW